MIIWHPNWAARRIIYSMRKPDNRSLEILRGLYPIRRGQEPIKPALPRHVHDTCGDPITFVVGKDDFVGRADGQSVGKAQTRGDCFQNESVWRKFKEDAVMRRQP